LGGGKKKEKGEKENLFKLRNSGAGRKSRAGEIEPRGKNLRTDESRPGGTAHDDRLAAREESA